MGKIARKYWDNSGVSFDGYPATNVKRLYSYFVGQLYDSVSRVILLDGIPEGNDYDFIMENLIMCGHIAMVPTKDGVRLLEGALGGKRNEFFRPTEIIVDNPVLGDIRVKNDIEGKMIYLTPHDRLHTPPMGFGGLSDLIGSTAQLLADNTASINVAQINGRVLTIFSATNQQEATAAEIILKEMYAGQPYKVIHGQNLLSKFEVNPVASTVTGTMLKELVELHQYILAQFWNAIGIDANFNMKRERLVSAEVEANSTSLKVPVSTILSELNSAFEIANEIFGTDIHARLNPEYKPLETGSGTGNGVDNNENRDNTETTAQENDAVDNSSSGNGVEKSDSESENNIGNISEGISSETGQMEASGENDRPTSDNSNENQPEGTSDNESEQVQNNIEININLGSGTENGGDEDESSENNDSRSGDI